MNLSGGDAIIHSLINNGIDTIFGLPGAQIYPLFDALYQCSDRIKTIVTRHEQGAAYMAFGYAKSSGKPSAYTVVPGPGVLNTSAALATAWGCNSPVLCVTGQVPTEFLGYGRGHLHEIPDQLATLRSLTKWSQRIDELRVTPEIVNEAFVRMQTGRPGPVALEMCWDTMAAKTDVELIPGAHIPAPAEPDPASISAAAKRLALARRAMIMTGGGAQHAAPEVLALAELLNAPVAAFRSGRGVVAEDHPLGVSAVAAHELWRDTDVIIGIGTRLELQYMRWAERNRLFSRPAGPALIRIDIDPTEMERLVPEIGIVGDARVATAALVSKLMSTGTAPQRTREEIAAAKTAARARIEKIQPQMAYLDVIREILPRDGFFVEELCQVGFTSYFGFPVYQPRTYVTPGFQGTLGFGFQTALGVKVAHPDKAVVSINGDGGFMFGVQELATSAQYNIGVVTLVFNNGTFGNVRRDQEQLLGGRVIGADFNNPDFMKLADSFGIEGRRVSSPVELKPVLARAIEADAPVLIEVLIEKGSEVSPWEFIHPPV
jgi:acetolactate synthase-1/2/3 large subunit